jgi:Domain of unknown function (DUF1931)
MAATQTTTVVNLPTFHRFFRGAAGLDVDKDDLKRYSDFIFRKIQDLLVMAQATARFNDRGMIEDWDLPITKGLQECVHAFEKMDEAIELQPLLGRLAAHPQLDLPYSEELERRLPLIAGGVSVALARAFKIVEPTLKHPAGEHWERIFRVFDTLL